MAIKVVSVSGGSRVTVRSGGTTTTTTSRGSRVSNSVTRRASQLQKQGLDSGQAHQFAVAESKGQRVTNLSDDVKKKIARGSVRTSAVFKQEISKFVPNKTSQIQGKSFKNLTQTEIARNKLDHDTKAVFLPSQTAQRRRTIAAQKRILADEGGSAEAFTVASKGKEGKIDLINSAFRVIPLLNNRDSIKYRKAKAEFDRQVAEFSKTMTPQQTKHLNTLKTKKKRQDFVLLIATSGFSPGQKGKITQRLEKLGFVSTSEISSISDPNRTQRKKNLIKLTGMSNKIASMLENWGFNIDKKQKESERKSAEKDAKLLAGSVARKELIAQYVPRGFKTISSGIAKIITLGEKTFKGTLDFGSLLANSGEKIIFLLPALGRNMGSGTTSSFVKEFVSPEQMAVLKNIYTDPRTYRDALIGAAVMVILGGVKGRNFTAKEVGRIPKFSKANPKGTILRTKSGEIGIVGKAGRVRIVPKGLRSTVRALTRNVSDFVVKNVTKIKPVSKFRIGTILRDAKGNIKIVSKGGRTVSLTKAQQLKIKASSRLGKGKRAKKTEIARLEKKALKKPLEGREAQTLRDALRKRGEKATLKQLNKEVNTLSRKLKIPRSQKAEFSKLYKNFRKRPNQFNEGKLLSFERELGVLKTEVKIKKSVKGKQTRSELKVKRESETIKMFKKARANTKEIEQFKNIVRNKDMRLKSTRKEIFQLIDKVLTKEAKRTFKKSKTTDIKLFLKRRGVKVNNLSDKAYDLEFGKSSIGITNGKQVWIRKSLPPKLKTQVLRHEAIHVLKDFGKISRTLHRLFPKQEIFVSEFRASILETSKFKFPTRVKIKTPTTKKILKTKDFYKSKGTTKAKVEKFQTEIRKKLRKLGADQTDLNRADVLAEKTMFNNKFARSQLDSLIKRIKTSKTKVEVKLSLNKADIFARKKGFKDTSEALKYERAFKNFKNGVKGQDSILSKIESSMAKRQIKASKLASKRFKLLRKSIVKDANKLLREGKISIKDKRYKVIKIRPKMPQAEAERLAIAITQRLNRIKSKQLRRQAKEVYKEIIKGKVIEVSDPALKGAIRDLSTKEWLRVLKNTKRLSIRGAKLKTKITKVARKKIRVKAKEITRTERLARKKQKRSPAGDKQARKIFRKRILEEQKLLERIARGDARVPDGYTLQISESGYKLVPKPSKIPKSKRIKTATEVIKKAKLPKGSVKIGKDGTIQVLKTVKKTETLSPLQKIGIRKAELNKVWKVVGRKKAVKKIFRPTTKLKLKSKSAPRKTRTKTKLKTVKKIAFKVIKASTVATALVVGSRIAKSIKSNVKQAQKKINIIKPAEIQRLEPILKNDLKKAIGLKIDLANLEDLALSPAQMKDLKQGQKISQKLVQEVKQILKKVSRKKKPSKKKPPLPPIPFIKLSWKKTPPKGKRYQVNLLIKVKGRIKEIHLKTTPNRALKWIISKVDNTTARSFKLKIVGVTKAKDVKKPSTRKFRSKISNDPKVLDVVEKTRHAIDTRGEKRGLRIGKLLKKGSRPKKVRKSKRKVVKKKTVKRKSKRRRRR